VVPEKGQQNGCGGVVVVLAMPKYGKESPILITGIIQWAKVPLTLVVILEKYC